MKIIDNPLWVERYRPQTVADTILPEELKATFQKFVDNKSVPNLLLTGTPGTGKTTVAKAMLEELGCDYIVINGSLERNIDTLRNDIAQFATSLSIYGTGRKYVILDEADFLNPNSFQPALRNFMEEFSKNCGFILTANHKFKIIDALRSRCSTVEFKIPNAQKPVLAAKFLSRVTQILGYENVEYDKTALAGVVTKFFPDWRRVLNELQRYSVTGKIDSGILANLNESNIKELTKLLKNKEFSKVRKWVADNSDLDANELFNSLYTHSSELVEPSSIPPLILIIAKYSYQNSFCANQEINICAAMVEIMTEIKFK